MYAIPIVLFLSSLWSFYRAWKQHNSGTKHYRITKDKDGFPKREIYFTEDKFPIIQIGAFWFGVALFAASIVTLIIMLSER